jgi:hypothetical protein
MRSAAVPGDSTDPTRAATAIVASPAWDLAVAGSIAAEEVFEAAASVAVVEAPGVAAVAGAGKLFES